MRFEKYLTLRGYQEGYEKSGGGFRYDECLDMQSAIMFKINIVPR
jgi:hypothetical protein